MVAHSSKALAGWRILVPRGGEWGNGIAATLRGMGAVPVVAPLTNFASTADAPALGAALSRLGAGEYEWLVVSNSTTVDVLLSHEVRVPQHTKIVAVGETTSSALTLAGFRVDFVPENDNSSRGLVKAWSAAPPRARVLVPQSETSDSALVSGLGTIGVDAEFVTAYRTVGVSASAHVVRDVRSGHIDGILITSGSVARQIQQQFAPLPSGTVVAAIGPRTAFDARSSGISVDVIAESRTAEALVDAFLEHVARRSRHAG